MRVAVVGGAGFIGSNLMLGLDDAFVIEKGDSLDFKDAEAVVHLAANADVRYGWNDPRKDIEANTLLTLDVLEAMRAQGVRRLVFASTGSVYEPAHGERHESSPVRATSLYAASKIAGEQLVSAYVEHGDIDATVLRFVSVLGPGYHHGLVYDFVQKLKVDPEVLEVIGPGTSQKSYVHVRDVCAAIETVLPVDTSFDVFNVGTDETWTPTEIAGMVASAMDLHPDIKIVGNTWVGDNPHILLNCWKLRQLKWKPQYTVGAAVRDTVDWLR